MARLLASLAVFLTIGSLSAGAQQVIRSGPPVVPTLVTPTHTLKMSIYNIFKGEWEFSKYDDYNSYEDAKAVADFYMVFFRFNRIECNVMPPAGGYLCIKDFDPNEKDKLRLIPPGFYYQPCPPVCQPCPRPRLLARLCGRR